MSGHKMREHYGFRNPIPGQLERCIVEVGEPPHYIYRHQCTRKRGHGPDGMYCRQHGRMVER